MKLYQLSTHPFYRKKRIWNYVYPDTFLRAVATIHFYQSADDRRYMFRAIEVDGSVCGFLECEKKTSSRGEVSYWLGVDHWNQGIMQEALAQLCREAFVRQQLLSIYALVEKTNVASMRVLEKNGFERSAFANLYHFEKYR